MAILNASEKQFVKTANIKLAMWERENAARDARKSAKASRSDEATSDCGKSAANRPAATLADGHSMFVLSLQGERGESGQFDLLRRIADAIDDLGDAEVYDVVWRTTSTGEENSWSISVYYSQLGSPAVCTRCPCHDRPSAGTRDVITEYHRYYGTRQDAKAFARNVSNHDFTLSNPEDEPEVCSVSKLLRRIAEAGEMLGKVAVDDIVLDFDLTDHGREPSATVHYRHVRGGKKKPKHVRHQSTTTPTQPESAVPPVRDPVDRLLIQDPRREASYLSRPRLLRWTADALEDLGDVHVHDLVVHEELTDGVLVPEYVSSVSVYFTHHEQPRKPATLRLASDFISSHRYVDDHIDPQMAADRANHVFYLYNPRGSRFSLPTLLRRAARAVEDLVDVEIDGVVLHVHETAEGRVPVVAVYYSRPSKGLKKSRRQIKKYARYLERRDRKRRSLAEKPRA